MSKTTNAYEIEKTLFLRKGTTTTRIATMCLQDISRDLQEDWQLRRVPQPRNVVPAEARIDKGADRASVTLLPRVSLRRRSRKITPSLE